MEFLDIVLFLCEECGVIGKLGRVPEVLLPLSLPVFSIHTEAAEHGPKILSRNVLRSLDESPPLHADHHLLYLCPGEVRCTLEIPVQCSF